MGSDRWCCGGRQLWVSRCLSLWVWVLILNFCFFVFFCLGLFEV